jgi:phosphorylcholine metabolism protein LicD
MMSGLLQVSLVMGHNFHTHLQSIKSKTSLNNTVSSIFILNVIGVELFFLHIFSKAPAFNAIHHKKFAALLNFTTEKPKWHYSKTLIRLIFLVVLWAYYELTPERMLIMIIRMMGLSNLDSKSNQGIAQGLHTDRQSFFQSTFSI